MKAQLAPRRANARITGTFVASAALLLIGLVPTTGTGRLRGVLRSLHSLELNRAERAAQAAGYYDALIDGRTSGRDELTLALLGKPHGWIAFTDINAAKYLSGQFVQFELKPNVDSRVSGTRFTTNANGLRDREYEVAKPAGVFRIALLGASIDMGWGVDTDQTYENRLEDWLNSYAAKLGLSRRFEILNFAMAAYSPLHRLEVLREKVERFQPDVVLYSATRLDPRLLQIHLAGLIQEGTDLKYGFVKEALADTGISEERWERESGRRSRTRERLKAKLEPKLRQINETTVAMVARWCHDRGIPIGVLIIPRASEEDGPELRSEDVRRISTVASECADFVLDISSAFDGEEPGEIEIAPWDDHPNARGHQLMFVSLGRLIVDSPGLRELLFEGAAGAGSDVAD